jgi:hypothetical protein
MLHEHIELEVLMAVTMKSAVSWIVMSCSVERPQCFGGTYCLHHQSPKVSQARNQQKETGSKACHEDGGSKFLQNIGLSVNYTGLQPRRL